MDIALPLSRRKRLAAGAPRSPFRTRRDDRVELGGSGNKTRLAGWSGAILGDCNASAPWGAHWVFAEVFGEDSSPEREDVVV